ncbi:50S ribosomal protein L4 [Sodalis-like secondary symbiont of Drepanosiphum platanoidis]|uniref:50S ribosomal protein L4 n=1 Tax=Sodalis-like secondary symbiont of Drepanosiphum platanoidis TaxID=2994493 RepID=UPI0034647E7C
MELLLQDTKNSITVSDSIFGCYFNESLIHQIIVSYATNKRQGTKAQKNRSEVSGSGRKPWKQKGTGRARAGSIRSPIWRSGGVTFAAKPKKYNQKINKKMYKGALKSIFSELIRQDRLKIFKKFDIDQPKTKLLKKKLENISFNNILIITDIIDNNLLLSSRSMNKINICCVNNINPMFLISSNQVITTYKSIKNIEEKLR